MVAVLKGDIVGSRNIKDQSLWMKPLTCLLKSWGQRPKDWDIIWGDSFQFQTQEVVEILRKALLIKSAIKQIRKGAPQRQDAIVDVRLAIGIGDLNYDADQISERNGTAFIYAAECFDQLESEKQLLGIRTPWKKIDAELYVLLRLLNTIVDEWTISAAELAGLILENPNQTQKMLGEKLHIAQNSVSYRYRRAKLEEVGLVLDRFSNLLKAQLL
jgi:hypothetical protein